MIANDSGASKTAYVAYFTMEVGLEPSLPTYSGGLGVLAGDTLKAAADLGLPMVGVTLLHRQGYFVQRLRPTGQQIEQAAEWKPEEKLQKLDPVVTVRIDGEPVRIGVWRYVVRGISGAEVPVYFLDTCLPENSAAAQTYTGQLYGGDARYRLCQEAVLGFGGVAILRALGHRNIRAFHMNEGHSALLTLALLEETTAGQSLGELTVEDEERVRERCVFTTHTPVPAGHDQFELDLARRVLGEERVQALVTRGYVDNSKLNMTYLALSLSRYINGVAMSHGKISRGMFPNYPIGSITNGIHVGTWISPPFEDLLDRHIPEWRLDSLNLRYAVSIPLDEIRAAHQRAKQELLDVVFRRTAVRLDPRALTIGFARRAATYKRADFVFSDIERLKRIARNVGPLQFIYGGKAHPNDPGGKEMIHRVFQTARALRGYVTVLYLEEYDMTLAKYLCSGVDLWLNTPRKPQEASGTSGMKAAINGVPSLSVLDGWWIEGHVENVTGWSIGDSWEVEEDEVKEAASLYDKLEAVILPMFYGRPSAYARIMRHAMALNGSFFNAHRMVLQYRENAYRV